jgi:AAA15 family ATPase/GTPase
MIEEAVILNYKSAKEVNITCRKLNIFIGSPNTGKSNILEALGLFTLFNNDCKIQELARFQTMHNLFYDNNIENPILIRTNTNRIKIQFRENFEVNVESRTASAVKSYDLFYDATGKLLNSNPHYTSTVNLYKFSPATTFPNKNGQHLRPPHGDNLVLMLMKNRQLRQEAAQVFRYFGYKLAINPLDSSILVQKEDEGVVISLPYTMASYMLQRFVFHLAALDTNEDSVIIFDEPESYASTEFTRGIMQRMAQDESNQFFVSSHNPSFLMSAIKNFPVEDLKIYYALYENYQTLVEPLIEEDYRDIMKGDMNIIEKLGKKLKKRRAQ